MKALIGMSGGVDSSVAAYLMMEAGYACVGATMRLYTGQDGCPCDLSSADDARAVADRLGIPFHTLDFSDDFQAQVMDHFVQSYEAGLTPNPCVECNRHLKFDKFLQSAQALGCDCIVTGHYARITQNGDRYLLRKAVEGGGVHPLYIDRVSTDFALRIEAAGMEEMLQLWEEMVQTYCLLVKKHATSKYSPLVQKVVARVDFNLAEDLSLRANAEALSVSASYLSNLFRKEIGMTITEYVNQKRMEHASFLLRATDLPVSAVGQRCGIQDDNYFTKIFKNTPGGLRSSTGRRSAAEGRKKTR